MLRWWESKVLIKIYQQKVNKVNLPLQMIQRLMFRALALHQSVVGIVSKETGAAWVGIETQ